jgi:hypothetical protein
MRKDCAKAFCFAVMRSLTSKAAAYWASFTTKYSNSDNLTLNNNTNSRMTRASTPNPNPKERRVPEIKAGRNKETCQRK